MGDHYVFLGARMEAPVFNFSKHPPEREGEERAAARLARERQIAAAEARAYLAAMNCPEDVKEFGRLLGVPTFSEMTWEAGFTQGWNMAVAAMNRARGVADNGALVPVVVSSDVYREEITRGAEGGDA